MALTLTASLDQVNAAFNGQNELIIMKKNILYAQSGGVTPVINATACGVIETARKHRDRIGKVLAGKDGIIGVLRERRHPLLRARSRCFNARPANWVRAWARRRAGSTAAR